MHDVDISMETYEFTCMRCKHNWERAYEVRHSPASGWTAYYFYDGVPCPAPWQQGQVCPSCGGYRVRLIPNHRYQLSG
jgi:Zn finger protein HypA/HybF involved in hydrogenase expression